MKIVTCELHKITLAALLLGVFSLSPLAKADDVAAAPPVDSLISAPAAPVAKAPAAPAAAKAADADAGLVSAPEDDGLEAANSNFSGGMSLANLRNVASGFNVRLVGDSLVMDGRIPRKCAIGASISVSSVAGEDGKPGQHAIKFIPGDGCDHLTGKDRKDMVKLSSSALFGASRSLADSNIDGQVCISHSDDGPETCDAIPNAVFKSQASFLQDAMAVKAKANVKAREDKEAEIINKLNILCKQGDYVTFGKEIEAARAFLGDVTAILAKVDGLKQKGLADQIKKAKNADDVNDAYHAYLEAAEANGWDTDDAAASFADKRGELLKAAVTDSSVSAKERARMIHQFSSDMRDEDVFGKPQKEAFGSAFFTLATEVREGAEGDLSKLSEAEELYKSSLQYANAEEKARVDTEIAKMYNTAADDCLNAAKENGKGSAIAQCDKIAAKAKKAMNTAIKAQGHVKGDDSLAALAGMKQEKIARFGQDTTVMSMSLRGYDGSTMKFNPQGGSYDASKYTDYTQMQQSFVQQMMMGGQRAPSGTGGSYFQ
ncbi:MAG: hypothetical protein ACXVB9_20230 [Bdellovibrionota bacterium]